MIRFLWNQAVKLENLYLFLPLFMLFLYGAQGVIGIIIFNDQSAREFLLVLVMGIGAYLAAYWFFKKKLAPRLKVNTVECVSRWPLGTWIAWVFGAYFIIIIYAVLSSEKIALLEALRGASGVDISYAREALFKTRSGWERSLVYLFALFSSVLVPYFLVICYLGRKKYRHVLLVLFILSLIPSMEKALIIKPLLPLCLIAFNGYLPRRYSYIFPALLLVFIFGTTHLSSISGGGGTDDVAAVDQKGFILSDSGELLGVDPTVVRHYKKYFPFGVDSSSKYLVNRVLWIPYVTAYDWIRYFHDKLDSEHLYGRTSLLVSTLTFQTKYPMEHEVFSYQWGGQNIPTATANANFLVDAFVNFGWTGVLVFAAGFGAITALIASLNNPAAKACYYFFAYQVAGGGLMAVLFSGGLAIFVLLAIFVRPDTFDAIGNMPPDLKK